MDDPRDQDDQTRIDLGEDLLEETRAAIVKPPSFSLPKEAGVGETLEERLKSAEILMSEGLIEEAKKLLRNLSREFPTRLEPRKKLEEIQKIEIEDLLKGKASPRPMIFQDERNRKLAAELAQVRSEKVLDDLHQSLKFSEPPLDVDEDLLVSQFLQKTEDCGARDHMDLGIAFVEMGLLRIAISQFQASASKAREGSEPDEELALAAHSLVAYCFVLSNRPFEAFVEIEPVLGDSDIAWEKKKEFIYLMGRACELLDRTDESLAWYRQVQQIDSDYRDAGDRLRQGSAKNSKK